MSRWNPCCCAGPVILPDDMVLVRAGWYHFMVMTRDGRIQVFIGSGVKIDQYDQPFWNQGIFSKIKVGFDGFNIRYEGEQKQPLWYIDELGIHVLSDTDNLDSDAWKLIHTGSHGETGVNDWQQNDGPAWPARDFLEGPPNYGDSKKFDMWTLYPEACAGWGGSTGLTGGLSGPIWGLTTGANDGYFRDENGYPSSPPNAVAVGGCPHYKIVGNVATDYYLYPDKPMEFNGSGISIGRPPDTARHAALIQARGLSLISGITLQTLYESYDLVAKPAPDEHPLAIPADLKSRLDSGERRVIDIECGAYHNIVRLDDNSIICWGLNAYGQCNVPNILGPSWRIPNGEIISASIDFTGITTSQRLVTIENPELQIYEVATPPATTSGSGGRARLLTDPATEPDGPRIFEVVGIEILSPGKGYRSEYINWRLPGNELNASVLRGGITFGVAPITDLSNIKNTICSIHAGFNTSAVLFHGGTALCWGDPDVADQVNSWEHIRISPIKKSEFNTSNCNGTNTQGYIDPEYPEFPENKYKNGSYNANTDWWGYWRTGTPAYPHFDLGVETNKIYPLQWEGMQQDINTPSEISVPYGICNTCNSYWNNSGQDKIKDFAVAMLRTGQIVTTRKINARNPSADLCRDCSYDEKYTVSDGSIGTDWIGPNINSAYVENNTPDGVDCLALAQSQGYITICSRTNTPKICDEYKTWYIPLNEIQCQQDPPDAGDYPEGIGCYSSSGNKETILYDHNWAYITEKSGQFYAPARQIRPQSHPLGPVPFWNTTNRVNATYGWETLVVATGRSHRPSNQIADLAVSGCASSIDLTPSKCVMDMGSAPCSWMCPSDAGGLGDFRRSGNVDQYGVPGVFRYPAQIANTLMCSAGTNTVNWMHYPKMLSPEGYENGIFSGTDAKESQLRAADIVDLNCETFHQGKGRNSCSECDYYTNNPLVHTDEIADTTNSCIYANVNNPSEDSFNNTNPLKEGGQTPCTALQIGAFDTYMLPSRPWGPWQLFTFSGTASPRETELSLCSWNLKRIDCPYMVITQKTSQNEEGIKEKTFFSWDGEFGDSEGRPQWFKNYYIGPSSLSVDVAGSRQESGTDLVRRPIRREGGIRPVSSAWKVNFQNPISIPACYYPDECYDFNEAGERIIPPGGDTLSGRCPRIVDDPTNTESPLAYVDCSIGQYGPCGGGILGGQVVNLAKYCFPETFPSLPTCIDNTDAVCGTVGCDQGIGNSCNKWFLNNPAISYATGRMFSVFIRRCPWYRAELSSGLQIAAGGEHSMVLKSTGEFVGWGRNIENQVTPTATLMKTIEGGKNHNIAITKNTENVICFGDNTYGQCDVPLGLAGTTAISAGHFHSMALKKNDITNKNEVFCWGCVKELLKVEAELYTGNSNFTDNTGAARSAPPTGFGDDPLDPAGLIVSGISGPGGNNNRRTWLYYDGFTASIPFGGNYDMHFRVKNLGGITATLAVEDFEKWVNFESSRLATIQIPLTGVTLQYGITQDWITVKAENIQLNRKDYSFVLRDITNTPGGATGWSLNWFKVFPQERNNKGQCDVPPTGVTSPSVISAGKYHSVAIIDPDSDVLSNVICWGDNEYGQCDVPEGLTGVVDIKAGDYFTLALTDRGTVKCWGAIDCSELEGLTGIIDISSGGRHGMLLKQISGNNREIIPFGSETYGLNIIPPGITSDPSGLTGLFIQDIVCGGEHNMIIRDDGTIRLWGNNNYGQLNIPDEIYSSNLVGGEFIWEPTCPTSLQESFPLLNFDSYKGWKGEFVGTNGTKIWTAGILLDPCPPWPIMDGITAYYPSWVPRAAATNIAKKGEWIDGLWTPTGGTGPNSYEKSINIDGFTLAGPGGPITNTLSTGPLQPKIRGYIS